VENWHQKITALINNNLFLNLLKFLQILGKFGNKLWQNIPFCFVEAQKFGTVPPHPPQQLKSGWNPMSDCFAFCSFILCCSCPTWSISNLSMKEGHFFGVMRSTEPPGCFRLCSWCLWKALTEEECISLVLCCLDLRCKIIEYWMISSLKIKLN
jgi:hypothetical protein